MESSVIQGSDHGKRDSQLADLLGLHAVVKDIIAKKAFQKRQGEVKPEQQAGETEHGKHDDEEIAQGSQRLPKRGCNSKNKQQAHLDP